jgi:hypothetical protein
MICSRCHENHERVGQRLCSMCHAKNMRAYRRRVKQPGGRDFGFVSHEIDSGEIDAIATAAASLDGEAA